MSRSPRAEPRARSLPARRPVLWVVSSAVLASTVGCTGDVEALVGAFEPLRVREGTFVEGRIGEGDTSAPAVTSIESASGITTQGARDRVLNGRVGEDAFAIAIGFEGLGSGRWIVPAADLDPTFPGERLFSLQYDLASALPPGRQVLQLAAIDVDGRQGEPFDLELCITSDLAPKDLSVCDPSLPAPARVVALQWSNPVDLDLVVETPTGKRISWKSPTGAPSMDGGIPAPDLMDPSVGRITRDSNADCEIDGRNAESVVWTEAPSPGRYLVYADLFDACGEPGVTFAVVVYEREIDEEGGSRLVEVSRTSGAAFDLQAVGGAIEPLFVTSFVVP